MFSNKTLARIGYFLAAAGVALLDRAFRALDEDRENDAETHRLELEDDARERCRLRGRLSAVEDELERARGNAQLQAAAGPSGDVLSFEEGLQRELERTRALEQAKSLERAPEAAPC